MQSNNKTNGRSDQVGIAILGCGYWGINYVRVFSELRRSRVAVICDQRPERLDEIARQFPGVKLTTEVDEALAMPGVDAAVVCTPATMHYDVARRALAANKHVLVEKPLTKNVPEAEALCRLADGEGPTLMVGHTFLYNPGVRKLKEYVHTAEIGRVYYLYSRRTNMGPIRHDVNALWDLAPHDVSIFNYLLNRAPKWVSALGVKVLRNSREDIGFISLGYEDDIVGHIHVSWADPYKVREVVVVGSRKRVVFDDLNPMERVRVFDKGVAVVDEPPAPTYGEYQFQMHDGDITIPRVEASEPLKNQCSHFLECIAEGKRPLTDVRSGVDVVRVMAAIDLSIQRMGAPVQLTEIQVQPEVNQAKHAQSPNYASTLC